MNEIKTIHIGRQAFTIAVDAHGDLKKYLDALGQKIKDQEVLEEIELRMAELLLARNGNAEAVIVKSDVAYLKDTLGQPSDFAEDRGEEIVAENQDLPRRFMRDPRSKILGGVSSGLAAYFGIDPIWVRLVFVALIFASGFGILLYLVLWVIMPEAKTSSDFLQMQGKPVTIESLADFAQNPELRSGAAKTGAFIVEILRVATKVLLWVIGLGMVVAGILGVLGSIAGSIFILSSSANLLSGVEIFPVGGVEVAAIIMAGIAGVAGALFLALAGASVLAKKWRLPNWATAGLLTIFFVGIFTAGPLFGASVPQVMRRIDDSYVTKTRNLEPFTALKVSGEKNIGISYKTADEFRVEVKTFGETDSSLLKASIENGVLSVDADELIEAQQCRGFCIYDEYPSITVYGGPLNRIELNGSAGVSISGGQTGSTLEVVQKGTGGFSADYVYPQKLSYFEQEGRLLLENLKGDAVQNDRIALYRNGSDLFVGRVDEVDVTGFEGGCKMGDNGVTLGKRPQQVSLNGAAIDAASLQQQDDTSYDELDSQKLPKHCIIINGSMY